MYTTGYQIGGHTYFGINYEYKIFKLIGIHAGIGYSGYTTGIKLHMNDCIKCPMLNISFKDGGFGEIGTFGAEFASQLFTFKKNVKLAAYAQFGFGYLANLSTKNKKNCLAIKRSPMEFLHLELDLTFGKVFSTCGFWRFQFMCTKIFF
ncbi:MAG: hypothetical protein HC831_00375 [Chloroflexia bacterium]|nr:hypothetical protein [Chloroflexia bacterium]